MTAHYGKGWAKASPIYNPSWWDGVKSCHYVISPSKQEVITASPPVLQEKAPMSPQPSPVYVQNIQENEIKQLSPSQHRHIEISSLSWVTPTNSDNNVNLNLANNSLEKEQVNLNMASSSLEKEQEWTEVKRKKAPISKQKHPMILRSSKNACNLNI